MQTIESFAEGLLAHGSKPGATAALCVDMSPIGGVRRKSIMP